MNANAAGGRAIGAALVRIFRRDSAFCGLFFFFFYGILYTCEDFPGLKPG